MLLGLPLPETMSVQAGGLVSSDPAVSSAPRRSPHVTSAVGMTLAQA